jgi:hypothetical protein
VERLVHVLARVGDVVVEEAGQRAPEPVNDAEGVVALGQRVHEHADGQQVVNVVEGLAHLRVLAHLHLNAEDGLGASGKLGHNALTL